MAITTFQATYLDNRGNPHTFEILARDVRAAILSATELVPTGGRLTRVLRSGEW